MTSRDHGIGAAVSVEVARRRVEVDPVEGVGVGHPRCERSDVGDVGRQSNPQRWFTVLVIKEYTVRFRGITPISPLTLTAEAVEHDHRTATVHATIEHDGQVTAEFEGIFVAPNRPR